MTMNETIIATLDTDDVESQVTGRLAEYLKENDLMHPVMLEAVRYMRNWYDSVASDAMYDAVWYALDNILGKEFAEEINEEEE